MKIFKLIFELLALYILYKVIFDFIIPVYRATKQMKGKMKDMQDHMEEQAKKQQQSNSNTTVKSTISESDYIDFEEIK
ncbi:MAG: hypothetical protein KF829_06910 [Ferruginibacter sp.]|nr:hypothetical protein [Ferruginibacter sp.]